MLALGVVIGLLIGNASAKGGSKQGDGNGSGKDRVKQLTLLPPHQPDDRHEGLSLLCYIPYCIIVLHPTSLLLSCCSKGPCLSFGGSNSRLTQTCFPTYSLLLAIIYSYRFTRQICKDSFEQREEITC